MEIEKKNVFKTNVVLLALLQDMCKKTGKVSKEEFLEEAIGLLSQSEEFSSRVSIRNIVLYHLKQIIDRGSIKIEYENGKEMIYLLKEYPLTLSKIYPLKGFAFLTIIGFVVFGFSILWTILTKELITMIISSIYLFGALITLVSYQTQPIIKTGERKKIPITSYKTKKVSKNLEKVLIQYLLDRQNNYGFKILKSRTKGPDFQIERNGKLINAEVEIYADNYIYNHPKDYAQMIIAMKLGDKEKIPEGIEVKLISIEDFINWVQMREDIIRHFVNVLF
jgi:hypothetical protein